MFNAEVGLESRAGRLVNFTDLTSPRQQFGSFFFRDDSQSFFHEVLVDHTMKIPHMLDQMVFCWIFYHTNFTDIFEMFVVPREIFPEVVECVVSLQLSHLIEPFSADLAAEPF